ncbi:MAG: META domain-containing protein [Pseudomonadota bacterium]
MKPLSIALLLTACAATSSADPTDIAGNWSLTEASGETITLEIKEDLEGLSGLAPCNRYFAMVMGKAPDFRPGPIGASKRACPSLDAEQRYFAKLAAVTRASRSGDILTLSGNSGPILTFTRAD